MSGGDVILGARSEIARAISGADLVRLGVAAILLFATGSALGVPLDLGFAYDVIPMPPNSNVTCCFPPTLFTEYTVLKLGRSARQE